MLSRANTIEILSLHSKAHRLRRCPPTSQRLALNFPAANGDISSGSRCLAATQYCIP